MVTAESEDVVVRPGIAGAGAMGARRVQDTSDADIGMERLSHLVHHAPHGDEGAGHGPVRHDDPGAQRSEQHPQRPQVRTGPDGRDAGSGEGQRFDHEDVVDVGGEDRIGRSGVGLELVGKTVDALHVPADTLLGSPVEAAQPLLDRLDQIGEQGRKAAGAGTIGVHGDQ